MAQEFTIKSSAIESKINELLPSQGGFQPGVDFSASTMVIPTIDLTETAEGSSVRVDLQTALAFGSQTAYDLDNGTATLVTTTGYFRVVGTSCLNTTAGAQSTKLVLNDGTTDKTIYSHRCLASSGTINTQFDLIVFLGAGDTLKAVATGNAVISGSTRQIADINGSLTNPVS